MLSNALKQVVDMIVYEDFLSQSLIIKNKNKRETQGKGVKLLKIIGLF